jgi:hypothetical protein
VVNDLRALMRENVAVPPPGAFDPEALVSAGRRRVRTRRGVVVGAAAALTAAAVLVVAAVTGPASSDHVGAAHEPPVPDAPVLHLADARRAVEGRDVRVLTSSTNRDLDRDNGHYLDGVTEDGLVLFRDGPRAGRLQQRLALLDPATGDKTWLPDLDLGQAQTWPVELGTRRLVLLGAAGDEESHLVAHVLDRGTRTWSDVEWPGLPAVDVPRATVGPDGRLYVSVPATHGQPPPGGWPTGADGEAEDADAQGDTYHLWSVSLSDGSDVRDEGLTIGALAFTGSSMVWTDSTNGDAGRVHTRDLSTGDEHTFDPHAGGRCNLLSFGATPTRVVLGEYCGTYADGVRDDRVQVLTSRGEQVVTIQGSGIEGALAGSGVSNDLVAVTSYDGQQGGTYVYDLGTDRFLRLSTAISKFGLGGPAPRGELLWHTPVNHRHGATQWLGEVLGGR